MQARAVGHPSWKNFRPADPEWAVIDFLQRHAEWSPAKARERGEQGLEEISRPGGADDGEWRPFPPLILREDHRVEKKRDEIGKMVRVKMGEQHMRDPMAVHAGFDEVHQRARTKIHQERLIRLHQIAGGGAGGMHVCTGTENRQAHRSNYSSDSMPGLDKDRFHMRSRSRIV